jgi:pantoate kinase
MVLNRISRAFSPAGISSFFEICDIDADGRPIVNLEKVGARGGGFGINKGVTTEVRVSEAKNNIIHVSINGKIAPEATTTKTVAQTLLKKTIQKYNVEIKHEVEVPIGAGFGSSAAGALTTGLALSNSLGLNLTYNQIGRIAHVAEVKCKTGLGTVGPLMLGGVILTLEPGAPGIAIIDHIPISPDYTMVCGIFGPISTREVLSSPEKRTAVNKWGRKTLEAILAEPSLENFLVCCQDFAEKTGFITERVRHLMKLADKSGAIGAAQNMVGEAVHALTTPENAESVVQAFEQVLPPEKILAARVDIQGARLIG